MYSTLLTFTCRVDKNGSRWLPSGMNSIFTQTNYVEAFDQAHCTLTEINLLHSNNIGDGDKRKRIVMISRI